ncbi:MAG: DUF6327 family protein [Mesonia hippocampi]|uniref:Uncharacterized protein n=1 Tax=Mesonia hippocampi TaxID=1628250 RepID=A0A840EJ85_9FLAO|nr:DUF6327 family protein [Mesonia hippocampi]MBB4118439.1 hypothetical protein [Mesonia hippocampi]
MKKTQYTSFDEVDYDLKILRLQTKINQEKMKRNFHYVKEDLSLSSIASNAILSFTKKAFVSKLITKILPKRFF